MRVLVEVVGRSLSLRGPVIHVGERCLLDTENPCHAEVLAAGWVRRVTPSEGTVHGTALDAPPVDRMMAGPDVAKAAPSPVLSGARKPQRKGRQA
jgi:hypothetical protein